MNTNNKANTQTCTNTNTNANANANTEIDDSHSGPRYLPMFGQLVFQITCIKFEYVDPMPSFRT